MKYYRIKWGYKDDEFTSVDENDVQTALRAQITGKVAMIGNASISGNSIIAIVPDYQREMGWATDYHLTGEDYYEIGAEKQREYRDFLENTKIEVQQQLVGGQKQLHE
jgi:hypothetical protein